MPLDKNVQRKEVQRMRDTLTKAEIQAKSASIVQRLRPFIKGVTAFYEPFGSEVDIRSAFAFAKTYALPAIQNHDMFFYGIDETTKFVQSSMGILEPVEGTRIAPRDFDVIVVPMVAFDAHCNRMGYGKGYYDRFLRETKALRVGVAFACQRVDTLLCDANDEVLDYIISEDAIYQTK